MPVGAITVTFPRKRAALRRAQIPACPMTTMRPTTPPDDDAPDDDVPDADAPDDDAPSTTMRPDVMLDADDAADSIASPPVFGRCAASGTTRTPRLDPPSRRDPRGGPRWRGNRPRRATGDRRPRGSPARFTRVGDVHRYVVVGDLDRRCGADAQRRRDGVAVVRDGRRSAGPSSALRS